MTDHATAMGARGMQSVAGWPWPAALLAAMAVLTAALRALAMVEQGVGALLEPRPWPSVLIVHLTAELLMATLPAVGAAVWWTGRLWGAKVLVLGLGAGIYASLNAIGWALATKPVLAIGMVVGLVINLVVGWRLATCPPAALAPRTWHRTLLVGWFILCALQIYGLWAVLFITGAVGSPLVPRVDTGYLAGRNLAEVLMVVTALAGTRAWRRRVPGWPVPVMAGSGMLLYAALNTTGEALLLAWPWVAVHVAILGASLVTIVACMATAQAAAFAGPERRAPHAPAGSW